MTIMEVKGSVFDLPADYLLVHCVSADYACGAGIAKEFDRQFGIKAQLKKLGNGAWPDCIRTGRVYNLVTKEKYWHKPTYQSLYGALLRLAAVLPSHEVNKLGMPRIGCGLDKLNWLKVEPIVCRAFEGLPVDVVVCVPEVMS